MNRRYWFTFDRYWQIVEETPLPFAGGRTYLGTAFGQVFIDLPADDPRHFQLGAVITPRAVLGI